MKSIKLIATDMDHTLLTEKSQLPPHFGDYLDKLDGLGVQFAIASGRPLYTLKDIFPKHQNQLTFICDNGGVISHRGKIIEKHLIVQKDYQDMVRFIQTQTSGKPLICGLNGAVGAKTDEKYDAVYREFYHQLTYEQDLSSWQGEADKVTIYLPDGDAQAVFKNQIEPRYGKRFSAAVSGPVWIDIMQPQIHKGNALKTIGKKLNIAPDDMMAFGDSYNDKEMLQTVKYSYLMANADKGMQPYADYHAPSNEDYGVEQILNKVIAAKS